MTILLLNHLLLGIFYHHLLKLSCLFNISHVKSLVSKVMNLKLMTQLYNILGMPQNYVVLLGAMYSFGAICVFHYFQQSTY